MSPIKAATTWPDAGLAIAGIGMVTGIGAIVLWQLFSLLRTRFGSHGGSMAERQTPVHTQGENV